MQGFSLPVKITDRKNDYIVYLKEGNGITSFYQLSEHIMLCWNLKMYVLLKKCAIMLIE